MRSLELTCFACMGLLDHEGAVCPACGHDNHHRSNENGFLHACVLQNQYVVGRLLGQGGFGATYLGFDRALERKVAIKEYYPLTMVNRHSDGVSLQPYARAAEDFRRGCGRTLEEGRMVARIGQVPGIVQMHNVIEANNTVYLVMEYVQGPTLTEWVKANGPMKWQELLSLMDPLMDALHTVHGMKVIHRDVSPDNIIIRESDHRAVLLDFGAAHTVSENTMSEHSVSLRRGYAPVEQYSSVGRQDGRIDEYALCATMYYALTGKRPPDATERMYAETHVILPAAWGADIPLAAEKVLLKGMAVRAEERYPSIAALQEAFLGEGKGKPVRKAEKPRKQKEKREREPMKAFVIYVGIVAAVTLLLEMLAK